LKETRTDRDSFKKKWEESMIMVNNANQELIPHLRFSFEKLIFELNIK
jgi:hypothetical protein